METRILEDFQICTNFQICITFKHWYKAFSAIAFDNYHLIIILNKNLPPLLKVPANLFQA